MGPGNRGRGEVTLALSSFTPYAVGPGRARSTARYALFLESISRPELASPLAHGRATILAWGSQWLALLGPPQPDEHSGRLADYLDGVILIQLAFPGPSFDPVPAIRDFLTGLIAAQPDL